ncbi:MAG: hypothetical protein U9Q88_14375 [Bacillota bacterium]|nr:hypothetical protein [Bacillota bacterium]
MRYIQESYRLINLFEVNNNLEIKGFENGSLLTKLKGKKESIAFILTLLANAVTATSPVVDMVAENKSNYPSSLEENIASNNKLNTDIQELIQVVENTDIFLEVTIKVTRLDQTIQQLTLV